MTEQISALEASGEQASSSQPKDRHYGHRIVLVHRPDGEVEVEYVPLTAEDLLDPQMTDEICQTTPHANLCADLFCLLESRYEDDPDAVLALRMKMSWGVEGLPNPMPDFAVIHGLRATDEDLDVLDVPSEGVRPSLIIEVVTSHYEELRRNDYEKKVAIYERAGVPEYLILEPLPIREEDVLLTGYRLDSTGRYQRIEPDSDGRLLSETTGLLFGKNEGILEVIDTRTGQPLYNLTGASRKARRAAAREAEALKAAELDGISTPKRS